MQDQVDLVPAAEEDLPLLYRLTSDPEATGEHEWFGWQDLHAFRRRWEENGLLDEASGVLMVSLGGERIGFVAWHKRQMARTSFCWDVGIALAPEMGPGLQDSRAAAAGAVPVRALPGEPNRGRDRGDQSRRAAGTGEGRVY
jgi:hypothetical protein